METKNSFYEWNLAPGDLLESYQIIEEIGRGGMGIVYKAFDTNLRRLVAIKFILGEQKRLIRKRFLREAHTLAQLKHENIVDLYNMGEVNKHTYLVMEYITGKTLEEAIREEDFCFKDMLRILEKVANGLSYAHEKNIIHRDLKPANIMIREDGGVKIMDFGLAKNIVVTGNTLTKTGTISGTLQYMAPEQVGGSKKDITGQVDVYALGALLYEGIAKRPMIEGSSPVEIWASIKTFKPGDLRQFDASIPENVNILWHRSVAPQKYRYASMVLFAKDLRKVIRNRKLSRFPKYSKILRFTAVAIMIATILFVFFPNTASKTKNETFSFYFQGINEFDTGQYGKALKTFYSLEKDTSYTMLPYYLGATIYKMERQKSEIYHENIHNAIGYLEKSYKTFPNYLDIPATLAECYLMLNNHKMATVYMEKCITIEPMQSQFYSTLATIYFQSGDYQQSEQNLRKAVALDQGNLKAANLLFELSARAPLMQLDNLKLLSNIFCSLKKISPPDLFRQNFVRISNKTYYHYLNVSSFDNNNQDELYYVHLSARAYLEGKNFRTNELEKGEQHYEKILLHEEDSFIRYLAAKALMSLNKFELLVNILSQINNEGKIIVCATLREIGIPISMENPVECLRTSDKFREEKEFLATLTAQAIHMENKQYPGNENISEYLPLLRYLLISEYKIAKIAAAATAINIENMESTIQKLAVTIIKDTTKSEIDEYREYSYYYLWNSYDKIKNNFEYAELYEQGLKDKNDDVNMVCLSFLDKFIKTSLPQNFSSVFSPNSIHVENMAFLKQIAPLLYRLAIQKDSQELAFRSACLWAFSYPEMDDFFYFLDKHDDWPPLFRYFMIRYFVLMDFVINAHLFPAGERIIKYLPQKNDPILKANVYFMMKYLLLSKRFVVEATPDMDSSVKASIINASGLNIWLPYASTERLKTRNIAAEYTKDASDIIRQASYSTLTRLLSTQERDGLIHEIRNNKDVNARMGVSQGIYSLIFDTANSTEDAFREYFVFVEQYDPYLLEKRYKDYMQKLAFLDIRLQNEVLRNLDYAIELDSGNAKLYYERAYLRIQQNRFSEAHGDLVKALEIVPDYYRYTATLAILKYQLGDSREAERLADIVVRQEDSPLVLETMTELYQQIAKYEKGRDVCKKLFANHPYSQKYLGFLIRYYCQKNDKNTALIYLDWLQKNLQRKYQTTNDELDVLRKAYFQSKDFNLIKESMIYKELPE